MQNDDADVRADCTVMSTASWGLWWRGKSVANTSMERNRTVAPPSLLTLARVRSGPTARDLNLPDLGQAARWRPCTSRTAPHSQWASTMCNGKRNLSRTSVRKCSGTTLNSKPGGAPCKTALVQGPEWEGKWAWSAAHDRAMTTVSRKWNSEVEDA